MISWNEMLKPENGFVQNNSVTLEVKIEAAKPEGASIDPHHLARPRFAFECSICMEHLGGDDISTTECGHLYCTACIIKTAKDRGVCPMCQASIKLDDLRRLYLPM